MAEIMHREYEKATEVERRKEEEKWKQTLSYQEQLEKQLEEQVVLHLRPSPPPTILHTCSHC